MRDPSNAVLWRTFLNGKATERKTHHNYVSTYSSAYFLSFHEFPFFGTKLLEQFLNRITPGHTGHPKNYLESTQL